MDGSGREASHQGITAGGEALLLLAERAVYWPRTGTLLIADAHFGKAASFRARGVPVPEATTTDNLDALGRLVERWSPRRIVFLGDFTHAREADSEPTRGALCAWRRRYSSPELILVRGNHDALESGLTAALDMRTEDEPWQQGGLALCHHPQVRACPVSGSQHAPGSCLRSGPSPEVRSSALDAVTGSIWWAHSVSTPFPHEEGAPMTDDADKDDGGAPVRLDKWLWAARFFKTRSLAARAVALGQVQLNGARTKPAREVRIDDLLQIELESSRRTVRVRGVLAARQPASIAQTLYAETEESQQARNKEQERKRLYREPSGRKGGPRSACAASSSGSPSGDCCVATIEAIF